SAKDELDGRPSRAHVRTYPKIESREPALGSTSNPWRTSETGHPRFPGFRRQVHGPQSETTLANLANFSQQSCDPNGFGGLLYGTDYPLRDIVRLHRYPSRAAPYHPFQCDGSSERGMDRPASRRSLSLRYRASVSAAW